MNIGVDLGWTVKGVRANGNKDTIAPDSFSVIKCLVNRGDTVFVISKVNSAQKERAEKWLKDVNFFEETGIKPENVYFCFEKKDKAVFVKALDIKIMIDDRTEVMANLPVLVVKFLISPDVFEYHKFSHMLYNCKMVANWLEIEKSLF